MSKTAGLKNILFVGGEPTLYTNDINRIISGSPPNNKPHITITTNGFFASSLGEAIFALKRFKYLDSIQLSYDRYHKKFLPIDNVAFLYQASRKLGKRFSVILTIQSPLDLTLISRFKGMGRFPVGVQKVHPTANLKGSQLRHIYPSFDPSVFNKRCPNLGKMVYLCGEGFSTCCSYLARSPNADKYIHPDITAHRESLFYKLISKYSFKSIMDRVGVCKDRMLPEYSSPCVLCNHIFSKADLRWNSIIKR